MGALHQWNGICCKGSSFDDLLFELEVIILIGDPVVELHLFFCVLLLFLPQLKSQIETWGVAGHPCSCKEKAATT